MDPSKYKDKKDLLEYRDRKLKELGAEGQDQLEFKKHENNGNPFDMDSDMDS